LVGIETLRFILLPYTEVSLHPCLQTALEELPEVKPELEPEVEG